MIKPWEDYIKPHNVYGNLYFAGAVHGSTHVIDSDDGLILIDTGYPQTLYLLLENIRALGFDPTNIRHVIHSHGHYDHLGATKALIELYHPKTYLGAGDLDYATGARNLTYAKELGYTYQGFFTPDVLLHDGDSISIGGTDFDFISTPGHTEGCTSIFFTIDGPIGAKRCGMHGGTGFNTLSLPFLDEYGLPHSLRDDFAAGLDKLDKLDVDIHVGNHIGNNDMFGILKRSFETGKNEYVDPGNWHRFLAGVKKNFSDFVKSGK